MNKRKRLIPFWLTPRCWFTSGNTRKLEELRYYYHEGSTAYKIEVAKLTYLTKFELETAINEIKYEAGEIDKHQFENTCLDIKLDRAVISTEEHRQAKLELALRYGSISEIDYKRNLIENMPDSNEKKLLTIEVLFKDGSISEDEYKKEIANINKEPWFNFDLSYDQDSREMSMTFDYNEYFWKKLKADGHPGSTEEEIIDNFIRDWGRKISSDEFSDGVGFDDELKQEEIIQINGTTRFYK